MLLRLTLLSLLCVHTLFAQVLKSEYTINTDDFMASTVHPEITEDFLIYHFDKNRNKKSFTSSNLIKSFAKQGIILDDESGGIVHVSRASNLDLTPIKDEIRAHYLSYYPSMQILEIRLNTNSFIQDLPAKYALEFKPKAHLYSRSTATLKLHSSKKRHFITYELDAKIRLLKARHNINRGKILTQIDLEYSDDTFTRLKGKPLEMNSTEKLRLKKRLAQGKILYAKDLEILPSVLKGKSVNVRLISGQVRMEFRAKCLQDGHIGDQVNILKADGKRLQAKVIGRNLVEIE